MAHRFGWEGFYGRHEGGNRQSHLEGSRLNQAVIGEGERESQESEEDKSNPARSQESPELKWLVYIGKRSWGEGKWNPDHELQRFRVREWSEKWFKEPQILSDSCSWFLWCLTHTHTLHRQWHHPVVLAFGSLRQKDQEFKSSLNYNSNFQASWNYTTRFCLKYIEEKIKTRSKHSYTLQLYTFQKLQLKHSMLL